MIDGVCDERLPARIEALGDVQQAVDGGDAWRATARRWRQDTINMAHRVYSTTRLLRRYTNTTCSLGMRGISKHQTIFIAEREVDA